MTAGAAGLMTAGAAGGVTWSSGNTTTPTPSITIPVTPAATPPQQQPAEDVKAAAVESPEDVQQQILAAAQVCVAADTGVCSGVYSSRYWQLLRYV